MKLYNRIKNLFYRPPAEYEEAYKSAINRVKQSQQTPETDPLIASCGKTIADIIVCNGYPSKGTTTKVYFNDGTVLVIDSTAKISDFRNLPVVETTVNLNRYTIEETKYRRTTQVYKESSL